MTRLPTLAWLVCALAALAGCSGDEPSGTALARLDGRAVLPAETYLGEGPVGTALDTVVNGQRLPLDRQPVQGFSSLLPAGDGTWLALQDNGFGTMANSGDVPLRWCRLAVDFDGEGDDRVQVLETVTLRDPDRLVPHPLAGGDSLRTLTGGDFDPEAFVRLDDGTFWIAEEFGPSLLHFAADGRLLDKPVPVPVPRTLRAYARGSPYLRSPDHPDLRFLRREATRTDLANVPRSGGFEGLAANRRGDRLYAAVEKGMVDDPADDRRLLLEFDPARRNFTGRTWYYRVDDPLHAVTALETVSDHEFLVLERDGRAGKAAAFKRLFRVHLGVVDADGFLGKTPVCDLLDLDDSRGLTTSRRGFVGLGRRFAFPYITPEAVAVADDSTLVLVNDNNFPFSSGRRPGHPDANDFVRLRLLAPLGAGR